MSSLLIIPTVEMPLFCVNLLHISPSDNITASVESYMHCVFKRVLPSGKSLYIRALFSLLHTNSKYSGRRLLYTDVNLHNYMPRFMSSVYALNYVLGTISTRLTIGFIRVLL